ncbi:MAG: serine/threonine-protein kinase [Planctomycetota bacterium]
MNLTPCPTDDSLKKLASGMLSSDESTNLTEHVSQCENCAQVLASLKMKSGRNDTVVDSLRIRLPQESKPEAQDSRDHMAAIFEMSDDGQSHSNDASIKTPKSDLGELGQYRLIAKVGEGGMGTVYKARHSKLDKLVAIKLLPFQALTDSLAIKRFEREMKAIGRVEHSNVVAAFDAGQIDGQHYLVMEYIEGVDLAQLCRIVGDSQSRLPLGVTCEIIRQAALGLQHAHDQGLIHRDIKPGNLMLNEAGVVKVLDLGLARLQIEHLSQSGSIRGDEITGAGAVMGTIGFMSPEQARDSRRVDQRTDLYSLGATFYRLLTGTMPFSDKQYNTVGKMLVAITTLDPPSIRKAQPELPTPLVRLIDSMIERSPDSRTETARQVADAVQPYCVESLAGLSTGKLTESQQAWPLVASAPQNTDPGEPVRPESWNRVWSSPLLWLIAIALLAGLIYLASILR